MENKRVKNVVLSFMVFILSLVMGVNLSNEESFAAENPYPDNKMYELFNWKTEDWQDQGVFSFKSSDFIREKKKNGDTDIGATLEFFAEPGDTYPVALLGSYQESIMRKTGTSVIGTWERFDDAEWIVKNPSRWTNLPKNIPSANYKDYTEGYLSNKKYFASYNVPFNQDGFYYDANNWPEKGESAHGINLLNNIWKMPTEDNLAIEAYDYNESSVKYQFKKDDNEYAQAKYKATVKYNNKGVIPPDRGFDIYRSTNHIVQVPQIVKVIYRDVDTLKEVTVNNPKDFGKGSSLNDDINATGLDKTITGYQNIGHQIVQGGWMSPYVYPAEDSTFEIKTKLVSSSTRGHWKTKENVDIRSVSPLKKTSKETLKANDYQKGIVVWLEKDKPNPVLKKTASKSEVPMEIRRPDDDQKNNDHRDVDYTIRLDNKRETGKTVGNLGEYIIEDELPIGVELKEPLVIERFLTNSTRAKVPEKKNASKNDKYYYELGKKNGNQTIQITGPSLNEGRYTEFYYTVTLKSGEHDEIKTNKVSLISYEDKEVKAEAEFKVKNKARLNNVKTVKNNNLSGSSFVSETTAKKGDSLTYQIRAANTNTTPPSTALVEEITIVDKIPKGLSKPTNIRDEKNVSIPEKSSAGSAISYYEWNDTENTLTIKSKLRIPVGKVNTFLYDTTVETTRQKVNEATASSPGIESSTGKATVNVPLTPNPVARKEAFKRNQDGSAGEIIKTVTPNQEFSYRLTTENKPLANNPESTDIMYNIIFKDIVPEKLAEPTNVRFEYNDTIIPLKSSEDAKKNYYEYNKTTRELKVSLAYGFPLGSNGATYSVTFDTKATGYKSGDKITNKLEVLCDDGRAEATHDLLVGEDLKVSFHQQKDFKDTEPYKVQPVPYGGVAKDPGKPTFSKEAWISSPSVRVSDAVFDGWYTDETFKTKFDFTLPITKDTEVYAKWVYVPFMGMNKKAFDRSTLQTGEHDGLGSDDGKDKKVGIAGNRVNIVEIGKEFSYMIALTRSFRDDQLTMTTPDKKHFNYIEQYLYEMIPDEVEPPNENTKVELVELEKSTVNNKTAINYKSHKVLKKEGEQAKGEPYYKIITNTTDTTVPKYAIQVTYSEEKNKGKETNENKGHAIVFNTKAIAGNKAHQIDNAAFTVGNIRSDNGGQINAYYKHTLDIGYRVNFETNGGSPVPEDQLVKYNDLAKKPEEDPTHSNRKFVGWYKDKELTQPFDFTKEKIIKNTTVYAKWASPIVDPGDGVTPIDPVDEENVIVPTNPDTNGLRIQYVSPFNFGEHENTFKAVTGKSFSDKAQFPDGKVKDVPVFVSIIDDSSEGKSKPWELHVSSTTMYSPVDNGLGTSGASIHLKDMNYADTGKYRPLAIPGDFNITNKITKISESGPTPKSGTWSLSLGNNQLEKIEYEKGKRVKNREVNKSTGSYLNVPQGKYKQTVEDYHATINWTLVPKVSGVGG